MLDDTDWSISIAAMETNITCHPIKWCIAQNLHKSARIEEKNLVQVVIYNPNLPRGVVGKVWNEGRKGELVEKKMHMQHAHGTQRTNLGPFCFSLLAM